MSAITIEDDDVAFQADLARAIAASLEPDVSGPPAEEVVRGGADGAGWNALLAAGQAAASAWGPRSTGTGLGAGRCSPAVLSVEEDDDDFQLQIAAAMAASIQSAEEDRRRRELGPGHAHLAHAAVHLAAPPAQGGAIAAQGPAPPLPPQAPHLQQQQQQRRQQQQGLLVGDGSVCCSGGLVLKPLASGRQTGLGLGALEPFGASAAAGGVVGAAMAAGEAVGRGHSPDFAGPTPTCSPCSSAVEDSEGAAAAAAPAPGAAAAAAIATAAASAIPAPVAGPAGSWPPTLLSSSPAKHARTPSLAGAADASQPAVKRSRSVSDSGAAPCTSHNAAGGSVPAAAAGLGLDARGNDSGSTGLPAAAWRGGGGEMTGPAQSFSPPERPASAASGCTASAVPGAVEDGECVAATASGLCGPSASVDPQQQQLPYLNEEPLELLLEEPPPLPPLPPQDQHQLRHRRDRPQGQGRGIQGAIADDAGCNGGGGGARGGCVTGSSGSAAVTLDLTAGTHSAHLQQQQRQSLPVSSHVGLCAEGAGSEQQQRPATTLYARRRGGSGGAAGGSLAPLDLSRPCLGRGQLPGLHGHGHGAVLHWSNPSHPAAATGHLAAAAAAGQVPCEASAASAGPASFDPMITDSPALPQDRPPAVSGLQAGTAAATMATTATPPAAAGALGGLVPGAGSSDAAVGDAGGALAVDGGCGGSWRYSGADRRMLLHQRVWWWLGPGQVQSGRIASIDRRSEPLLYSVRLDGDGLGQGLGPGAVEAQTIIATADCLFPFLCHGDMLMCRLPPSACREDGASSRIGGGVSGWLRQHHQRRQLDEWPLGFGGVSGEEVAGAAPEGSALTPSGPCAWMRGVLQHCVFDGRVPMVHVLLGPEQLPYSAPYEFVVPVSDAAEGSGCGAPGGAAAGGASGCYGPVSNTSYHNSYSHYSGNNQYDNNTCMDMVPVGPAA